MFESFVIMLREGVEAALIVGILLATIRRMGRDDLERPVFMGLGIALIGSIGAALALERLAVDEEVYEGGLYLTSAVFVGTMLWWVHRKSRTFRRDIEARVERAVKAPSTSREMWGLGAFTFIMVFREGAEAVMMLSAVRLTRDAMLSFIGSVLGLTLAVLFCVMFVRKSLHINLRRFFVVTEWLLGIFVFQLLINGYHELSETGIVPETERFSSILGSVAHNNLLFVTALLALPLFIWLSRERRREEDAR